MIYVAAGIRCFRERFDVVLSPFDWRLGAETIGSESSKGRCSSVAVACGPVRLASTSYAADYRSIKGPAICLYCGDDVWTYELRVAPFLWRMRWKAGFISVGPVKLYGYRQPKVRVRA